MPNNRTINVVDRIKEFGTGLIIIPLVLSIQTLSIGKAFASMYKYELNPSQEILAVSIASMVGACFGGFTACASFSRSAINAMSGARSQFSSKLPIIYTSW